MWLSAFIDSDLVCEYVGMYVHVQGVLCATLAPAPIALRLFAARAL